jgi:N6-adenosine-specific RNA methylase IME4
MPSIQKALEVIAAWGFTYRTAGFVWVKQNKGGDGLFMGMGNYTRANAELCLIATRGNPKRLQLEATQGRIQDNEKTIETYELSSRKCLRRETGLTEW